MIIVNPEDVAIVVVDADAVVHQVIFCVYQIHCYQSFHLNWSKNPWAYLGLEKLSK